MNSALIGHRIRAGLYGLPANLPDTYAISALPIQSDQEGIPWSAPMSDVSNVPMPAELRQSLSMQLHPVGFYGFSWTFSYWTVGMFNYWATTFLTNTYWGEVTVMTYNHAEQPVYLNAITYLPDRPARQSGGYKDVTVVFKRGVIIG